MTPPGMTPDSVTPAYNILGYRHHDRTTDVRKHELPAWNLHRLKEWIVKNDFDVVLIEKSDNPARGRPEVTHHFECSDSTCPGGC